MKLKKLCLTVALVSTASFAVAGESELPKKKNIEVSLGVFQSTSTGSERGFDLSGRAMLLRENSGKTEAFAHVLGLTPNYSFATHVHNLPCELGGGGHYKMDPTVAGAIESNEIWPIVEVNADGVGSGYGMLAHSARPEAQSMVIHDMDGARIGCADLARETDGAIVTSGQFKTTHGGTDMGMEIEGLAQMDRSHLRTYVTLRVKGLDAGTRYGTHVHDLPCNVSAGGAHYKIDPAIEGTVVDNEIHPMIMTDANGYGSGNADVAHVARPEAQSVVIHAEDGTRIACANLYDKIGMRSVTKGQFITTETGIDRGMVIKGQSKMERKGNGKTTVSLRIRGLEKKMDYNAHVHNKPCRLGGGSHYKIDATIDATLEENEIWLPLKNHKKNFASVKVTVKHLARPEAQSIVIHADDGARIACSDLD